MVEYLKKEYTTDVLVIGGGMAAVFAATRAMKAGAKVMMIDKGSVGRSGQTPFANGMTVFDEDQGHDREEWHRMIKENSKQVNNPAYLDNFMDYSKSIYTELEEWGAMKVGFGQVFRAKIQSLDIELLERTMVTTLLEENGKVVGAIGFKLDTDEAVVVKAKAVILCTGAGGFKPSGFQVCSLTFDGDAMAYRIGAQISGKEYVDTHFTLGDTPAYCWGQWQGMWSRGLSAEMSGPVDGGGQALDLTMYHEVHESGVSSSDDAEMSGPPGDDESGERSGPPMDGDDEAATENGERPELSPEGDEQAEGGPGGQGSMSRLGGASAGLSVHKAEGLFPADNQGRSNVEGLYAAGDCLSSMLVGSIYNGVVGFSMTGSATQGAAAGEAAAAYAENQSEVSIADSKIETALIEMFQPLNNEQGFSPGWVEQMIQGVLIPYYVLYIKEEDRLKSALTNIEFYRDHFAVKLRATDLHDLRKAHEVKNMLLNAEMKLRASLFRTESRGNHYREDYPESNDNDWLAWVVLQKGNDGIMSLEKFYVDDFEKRVV